MSHNYNIQDLWFVATSSHFQPHSLSQIPRSNSLVQTKSHPTKLARMKNLSSINEDDDLEIKAWSDDSDGTELATREWICNKRQQKVCSMASNSKEQSPPTTTNVDCGSCSWQMAYLHCWFLVNSTPSNSFGAFAWPFLFSQSDGFSSQTNPTI